MEKHAQEWLEAAREELPEAAHSQDLSTLPGRLRAAMIRRGIKLKPYPHRELVDYLAAQTPPLIIERRTAHNWFLPNRKRIESEYLFGLADALGVCARWLATGEPPVVQMPAKFAPGAARLVDAYQSIPAEGILRRTVLMGMLAFAESAKKEGIEAGEDVTENVSDKHLRGGRSR